MKHNHHYVPNADDDHQVEFLQVLEFGDYYNQFLVGQCCPGDHYHDDQLIAGFSVVIRNNGAPCSLPYKSLSSNRLSMFQFDDCYQDDHTATPYISGHNDDEQRLV